MKRAKQAKLARQEARREAKSNEPAKVREPMTFPILPTETVMSDDSKVFQMIYKLSDIEKVKLTGIVYNTVLENTESFHVKHIGSALAYLLGAINNGTFIELSGPKDKQCGALYRLLLKHLPPNECPELYFHIKISK